MEYVNLGSTGTKVSQLCLGTWRFGKETGDKIETNREEAHDLLNAAWDAGINFIDTANSYGDGNSERYIGEWLEDHDREDFVLASKVYWSTRGIVDRGLSRKNVRAEIERTLNRLGTEYVDIYYVHAWHPESPIEETLSALSDLVHEGKIHYLAASNLAGWQLIKSLWTSDVNGFERFEIVQPKFNAVYQDPVSDLLAAASDQELAVCPYSPLEGGFLTGKYERGSDAPAESRGAISNRFGGFSNDQWVVLEAIREVAGKLDATPSQVALRWLVQQDFSCIPIIGARTTNQLEENIGATKIELTSEQIKRIEEPNRG
jgi:1-deoxyxylulose-5-phosphate synthase